MNKAFFLKDTRHVAKNLLGMELVRKLGKTEIRAVITETEAYLGLQDRASHAYKGKTKRNEPMFGSPGTIYVYLIYGLHWCLNFVVGPKDHPHAVLIRGIKILKTDEGIRGPGRVTKKLKINKSFNHKNLFTSRELYLDKRHLKPKKIKSGPRVGIDYAGSDTHKPWRYMIE
jgi:DNA-3-methyladenine glycosylase